MILNLELYPYNCRPYTFEFKGKEVSGCSFYVLDSKGEDLPLSREDFNPSNKITTPSKSVLSTLDLKILTKLAIMENEYEYNGVILMANLSEVKHQFLYGNYQVQSVESDEMNLLWKMMR